MKGCKGGEGSLFGEECCKDDVGEGNGLLQGGKRKIGFPGDEESGMGKVLGGN